MKRALIFGVNGQDGAYLAKLLLDRGYYVIGTSRDAFSSDFRNLSTLGILTKIDLISVDISDFRSVLYAINNTRPIEIYNLAGQTSVRLSFEQPVEAIDSIAGATLNILEAIRFVGHPIRFYNAGSSDSFGDTGDHPASENTPFSPDRKSVV
jgi:GDPmannose 4,6-dehydratase